MAVSSYGSSTRTSGVVRIVKDLDLDLAGRHVLLVEDIVDSGLTLSYLRKNLLARNPASLEVCALLVRDELVIDESDLTYVGLPDRAAVGRRLRPRRRGALPQPQRSALLHRARRADPHQYAEPPCRRWSWGSCTSAGCSAPRTRPWLAASTSSAEGADIVDVTASAPDVKADVATVVGTLARQGAGLDPHDGRRDRGGRLRRRRHPRQRHVRRRCGRSPPTPERDGSRCTACDALDPSDGDVMSVVRVRSSSARAPHSKAASTRCGSTRASASASRSRTA